MSENSYGEHDTEDNNNIGKREGAIYREWVFTKECYNPYYPPKPKGKVEEKRLEESGLRYLVYFPPGYEDEEELPLLLHLHGATERFAGVKRSVKYTAIQFEKKQKKIVIVAPYDKTEWSWFIDGNIVEMYSMIQIELLAEIENLIPNISMERESRFVQGFCTGGFGAIVHGLKNSHAFSKIIVWDGVVPVDFETIQNFTAGGLPLARAQFGNYDDEEEIGVSDANGLKGGNGLDYFIRYEKAEFPYRDYKKPKDINLSSKPHDTEQSLWITDSEIEHFDQWNPKNLLNQIADIGNFEEMSILMYQKSSGFLSRCSQEFINEYNETADWLNIENPPIQLERTPYIHSFKLHIQAYGEQAVNFLFTKKSIDEQ